MAIAKKKSAKGVTQADLRKIALSFPDTAEGVSYTHPAFLASGKFFTRYRKEDNSFVLAVGGMEYRDMLLEMDPRPISSPITTKAFPVCSSAFSTSRRTKCAQCSTVAGARSRRRNWCGRWKRKRKCLRRPSSHYAENKMASASDLIAYWSRLGDARVHPDDQAFIKSEFATTLYPVPWAGPLESAQTYLLFLNPGLSPDDESYEANNAAFREVLRTNILGGTGPYFYLLEKFATHPGYSWARTTFGPDIREHETGSFCVVQLVPYHSKEGYVARRVAPKLPSSNLAREFIRRSLIPRANAGEIGLIVARSAKLWEVDDAAENDNVVIYRRWECRRALQTSGTRGGRLLRKSRVSPSTG
jgi:hypothetical protein